MASIFGDESGGGGGYGNLGGGAGGDGGGDNDVLNGTSGNDVIFGDGAGGGGGAAGVGYAGGLGGLAGSGNDIITGGEGDDILFGDNFNGDNGTTGKYVAPTYYSPAEVRNAPGFGLFGNHGGYHQAADYYSPAQLQDGLPSYLANSGTGGLSTLSGAGNAGGNGAGSQYTSASVPFTTGGKYYTPNLTHAEVKTRIDEYNNTVIAGPGYYSSAPGYSPISMNGLAGINTNRLDQGIAWGKGDDVLDGGAGSDDYLGQGGSDTFIFDIADNTGSDIDTIHDYNINEADVLDLRNAGVPYNASEIADILSGVHSDVASVTQLNQNDPFFPTDTNIVFNNGATLIVRDVSSVGSPGLMIFGDVSGAGGGGGYANTGTGGAGGAGGGGNDTISGTDGNDWIIGDGSGGGGGGGYAIAGVGGAGGGGNDQLFGGGGNDLIIGDGFAGNSGSTATPGYYYSPGSGGSGFAGGSGGSAGFYSGVSDGEPGNQGAYFAELLNPLAVVTVPAGGNGGNSSSIHGEPGQNGGTGQYSIAGMSGINGTSSSLRNDFKSGYSPSVYSGNYGSGDDLLDGGLGSDTLMGLGGSDTFVFDLADSPYGHESDVILDFNKPDADKIRLEDNDVVFTSAEIDQVLAGTHPDIAISDDGTHTTFTLNNGATLEVYNIVAADLANSDFVTSGSTPSSPPKKDIFGGSLDVLSIVIMLTLLFKRILR